MWANEFLPWFNSVFFFVSFIAVKKLKIHKLKRSLKYS
jgi:hypothetical protein